MGGDKCSQLVREKEEKDMDGLEAGRAGVFYEFRVLLEELIQM